MRDPFSLKKFALRKYHQICEIQNLGFLRKNLKVKKAYLGDFSAKNEKNNYGFGKQMKSLLSKSVLRFGQKCIYKKLWLFQNIFQKNIGGQKNVGHTPNLNFSIFFLFYIYKKGSFKHYFFLRFPISKKLTRPSVLSLSIFNIGLTKMDDCRVLELCV